jgi:GNAT superfamily N-acetyltransferase
MEVNFYSLEELNETQLNRIAKMHMIALPNSALSNSGVKNLLYFYQVVVKNSSYLTRVAMIEDRCVGLILLKDKTNLPKLREIQFLFKILYANIVRMKFFMIYDLIILYFYRFLVNHDAWIEILFVDEQYFNLGIGKKLFNEVINSKEKNFRVSLNYNKINLPAEIFYRKIGFRKTFTNRRIVIVAYTKRSS